MSLHYWVKAQSYGHGWVSWEWSATQLRDIVLLMLALEALYKFDLGI
jgi:hypothetical protein